jgi:Tol biopolymer transport system component
MGAMMRMTEGQASMDPVSGRIRRWLGALVGSMLSVTLGGAMAVLPAVPGETTRVSVDSSGAEADISSDEPAISADGRYVAFASVASNLVADDTNDTQDVFVHDRETGETTRVSVDSTGEQANGFSEGPAISADGRYVAFYSFASNLVADDTNERIDVFVHDRKTGETTRVSVDSTGTQANGRSDEPAISADGRYVAFVSVANNLVADDTNDSQDVFVHDRESGETTLVSVDSTGTQANGFSGQPAISADGRYVAFYSFASNLVADNTNDTFDVFVHDRERGETTRVSVDSTGTQANGFSSVPAISADGRYVAFRSDASNLVEDDTNGLGDVFVHDRLTGATTRVSVDSTEVQANDSSRDPAISADGRYVAFRSGASNLVADDANGKDDIFVHDRLTGETTRVSVDSTGVQANDESREPAISADGRYVAFESRASNLVADDTNNEFDVFVHDRFPSREPVAVRDLVATPNPIAVQGSVDVTALASGGALIDAADWTLHGESGPMAPADGTFDAATEELYAALMAPSEAGIYDLCVNATDVAGNLSDDTCVSLVVYDPSAGFVTGGGWIWSPPGALVADSSAMGRAKFGFVSRYRKGANVPDGNTQFEFRSGSLDFHSSSYEWLVIGGNYARFKGAGRINGANAETGQPYQFMIWAGDGNPDTFRIKIWYEDGGEVLVYDNGMDQSIGGGQIIVHTRKGKGNRK